MANPEMGSMPDHYPHRDDQVEAWIKDRRDQIRLDTPLGDVMVGWIQLNDLLDEYRLAADTGMSLDEVVNPEKYEQRRQEAAPKRKKKMR